jgi:putative transcriptional regulator
MQIVNTVREVRKAHGDLTQQQLADAVGVTRQTIIALEKGAYNPSLLLALQLAEVLQTNVESLFTLKPSPQAEK